MCIWNSKGSNLSLDLRATPGLIISAVRHVVRYPSTEANVDTEGILNLRS
jgi:hypothetical protein